MNKRRLDKYDPQGLDKFYLKTIESTGTNHANWILVAVFFFFFLAYQRLANTWLEKK